MNPQIRCAHTIKQVIEIEDERMSFSGGDINSTPAKTHVSVCMNCGETFDYVPNVFYEEIPECTIEDEE
jgi:hypothetical protein